MDQQNERNNIDKTDEIENEGEVEQLDFTKPHFAFEPHQVHEWRQQGYYLICKSCELEHAVWIGAEKILTGLNEDGTPILRAR